MMDGLRFDALFRNHCAHKMRITNVSSNSRDAFDAVKPDDSLSELIWVYHPNSIMESAVVDRLTWHFIPKDFAWILGEKGNLDALNRLSLSLFDISGDPLLNWLVDSQLVDLWTLTEKHSDT